MSSWNLILLSVVLNVPAVVSICWAGHLASLGTPNWGWFLTAGVLATILASGSINLAVQKTPL